MEKQNKVLNSIKRTNKKSESLSLNLGTKKNDECYTSMQDILNELSYWANLNKFEGKRIVCPCDWDVTDDRDIYGIEINYKEDPAEVSAFKSVKSVKIIKAALNDWYSEDVETEVVETKLVEYELKEDEIEDFLRDKLTCNFVRTLTQNARRWGIRSITASGYNPATGNGIKFQDIDYSKYDVCITNPPFSLYPVFMKTVIDKIDFIILAPFMNRSNPSIGLPLMLRQAYLGHGVCLALKFDNPTLENKFNTKSVACDWITSFSEAQEERNTLAKKTGVNYELYKDEFVKMSNMEMKDGTYPIRVPTDKYPDDYTGWMFGPINIIDRISYDEYEWYGTHYIGYYNKTNPDANPFKDKASDKMLIDENDKHCFAGIVFRKKTKEDQ